MATKTPMKVTIKKEMKWKLSFFLKWSTQLDSARVLIILLIEILGILLNK